MRHTVLTGLAPLIGLLVVARVDEPKTPAEKFQALVKAQQKAQRDFSDAYGPIVKRWNVNAWPTLYLLDGKGVVRFKGDYLHTHSVRTGKDGKPEQYSSLDDAVELLVKEAEKKS